MANLTDKFLNEQDREKIKNAVKEAEKHTSGEIVPMVVSRSYHYPMSDAIGGVVFAFPLSLIMTYLLGGWFWIGHFNLWLFFIEMGFTIKACRYGAYYNNCALFP